MQAFEGVFIDPYLYSFDLFGLFLIDSNSFFKFHLCIEILFKNQTHPQKLAPAVASWAPYPKCLRSTVLKLNISVRGHFRSRLVTYRASEKVQYNKVSWIAREQAMPALFV
jgi:hypothetical protein